MSYASPEAALAAVAAALKKLTDRDIHVGSAETGATLDCCCDECDGPLVRVESRTTRAKEGVAPLYGMSRNRCRDLVLDVVVTLSTCWTSFDGDGPDAVPVKKATADGTANVQSWWKALDLLAAATPMNQSVRFVSASDTPPEGGCVGWSMQLEVDVSLCG